VFGEPSTVKEVPAVRELSTEQLVQITEDLDDLAKKLGFGAKAEEQTDVYGIDPDWNSEGETNASSAN